MSQLHLGAWRTVQMKKVSVSEEWPKDVLVGNTLVCVEDVTGDGVSDVLVGCTSRSPKEALGRLLLLDGRTAAVLATVFSESDRQMSDYSRAVVGDVDGDGCRDWLVGAPAGATDARHGYAELWSSKTHTMLDRLEGEEPGFGVSVAGLGDCDGDGIPEFAVA